MRSKRPTQVKEKVEHGEQAPGHNNVKGECLYALDLRHVLAVPLVDRRRIEAITQPLKCPACEWIRTFWIAEKVKHKLESS